MPIRTEESTVDLRHVAGLSALRSGLFHQNWYKLCIKLQRRFVVPPDIFATFSLALMHEAQVCGYAIKVTHGAILLLNRP